MMSQHSLWSTPDSTTEATDCFTCEIVSEYVDLANGYTQGLSASLLDPMWTLFLSLAGLWIVIQGIRVVVGQSDLAVFAKEFIYVLIAWFLLSGQGPDLVKNIYEAALAMMGSAASVALQVGGQGKAAASASGGAIPLDTGMVALVWAAEDGVRNVFHMAKEIAGSATLTNILPILYALVLIVPYFLLLVVFFAQVVISIFRIMMLAALSPFLMMAYAFGWGRDMMKTAMRTLMSAMMVLYGATAALGVVLYGVKSLGIGDLPDESIREIASITNPDYLLAVALGILGTAFMAEATGISNSIAGSVLTNTAAGVITAGASAAAGVLLSNPVTRRVTAGLLEGAQQAGWAGAGTLLHPSGAAEAAKAAAERHAKRVKDLVAKAKGYGQAPDQG